jgi:hypothetical protein
VIHITSPPQGSPVLGSGGHPCEELAVRSLDVGGFGVAKPLCHNSRWKGSIYDNPQRKQ